MHRLAAAATSLGCISVLGVALALSPSAEGHGTHTALGLPRCGWVIAMDKPCPSCGMTTAFSHAVRGELGAAFAAQPFGALLALLTAACFWGSLHVAATGSQLGRVSGRLLRPRMLLLVGVLAAGAWVYKFVTWPV